MFCTASAASSIYGIISICLFFAVFAGLLVWAFCLKKPYLKSMSELPLDDETTADSEPQQPPNPEDHHE